MPMHSQPRLLIARRDDDITDEITLFCGPARHPTECGPPRCQSILIVTFVAGVAGLAATSLGIASSLLLVVCTQENMNTRRAQIRQLTPRILDGGRANRPPPNPREHGTWRLVGANRPIGLEGHQPGS
jgi:hypothetical protein